MAENNLGRNITFPIYYDTVVNGTATQHETGLVIHKATVETSVMSLGDKITGDVYYANNSLQVTMQEYIVYNNVHYILVNPPTIIREGMVVDNGDLRGMTKYSFEFYHPMYVLGNFPFSDVAVSQDEKRYLSENKSFSWIGKPQDFIDKINKNLEGTEWIVVKSENFPEDTEDELSDVLTLDNNTIADALKIGYETWGLPYIVDQIREGEQGFSSEKKFKVIFGLPSNVIKDGRDEYVFRMGQGVGLKNNSRTPRNNKIVTRIAGYGSENNIPYGYPQIRWYGDQRWEFTKYVNDDPQIDSDGKPHGTPTTDAYPLYMGILGGQYVKLIKHPFTRNHLMPSVYRQALFNKVSPYLSDGSTNSYYDSDIELVDYYDAVYSEEYPYVNTINVQAPNFEIHAFEDIKPELDEAEIVGVQPINNDGTDADGWDDTMDDDGNYLQRYFKLTLPQLDFDLYACAAITEEMQINMRSGACIGCTFPVQVDWEDYKKNFYDDNGNFAPSGSQRDLSKYPNSSLGNITVIVQKEYSTFGVLMPNIYQTPVSGDEFVILGISLPDTYVINAEVRLSNEMKSYMLANNIYYYDYPLKFDEYFLATHTNILSQIRTNTQVKFQFANEDHPMTLFVKQIVIKYGDNVLPQYDITLTDSVEVVLNQIGQVADSVEKLSTLVSVLRQSYNRNVWGEIAKKLSKTSNDTAQGEITFVQGLKIGSNGNNGIAPNGDATLNDANVNGDITITHVETPQGGEPIVKEYGITNDGDISGEGLTLGDYSEGLLGTGGVFKMINGKSYLEADNLYVRMKAYFDTLEIRRYIHSGGNRVASAAGCKVTRVEQENPNGSYYCFFKANDGDDEITNDFVAGDLAYCHTTNLAGGSPNAELNQQDYWRLVMETGSVNAQGVVIVRNGMTESGITDTTATEHYIKLANTTQPVLIGEVGYRGMRKDSDTAPKAGDDVVQLGNVNNPARRGAIVEAVSGAGCAPTYRIYQGLGANSSNLYTFTSPKVDMGYDMENAKAYLNVFGNFYVGAEGNNPSTYVRYTQGDGTQQNPPLLEIKAKIDASSPYGETSETIGDMFTNLNDRLNNAEDEIGDLDYLKTALNEITTVEGGLILTNLIQLRQNNTVWAGISGQYSKDIAAWFGGLMKDYESLTDAQKADGWSNQRWAKSLFRFDGSGYLAGGNISWENDGDTMVNGTIKADNFFHAVCHYLEYGLPGIYYGSVLYYYDENSVPSDDDPNEPPYSYFDTGSYYTAKEIYSLSRGAFSSVPDGFIATTGKADVVMCAPNPRNNWGTIDGQLPYVTIPKPEDFQGKVIEVGGFCYETGASGEPTVKTFEVHCVCGDLNPSDTRMTLLVWLNDSQNGLTTTSLSNKVTISTGGVARFLSVQLADLRWVWVLLANQTGGSVVINGGGGSGTSGVTSIGMSVPTGFSVSTQTITDTGSFDISFARGSLSNGLVLATPSSGNNAPSWRALVASDIPNLDWSKITSGTPTTLGEYGITDAKIENGEITLGNQTITPLTQHQSLADYLTRQEAQNTYSLNTHDHDGTYLRLSGADVMAGNLKLGAGTAVKANDKDTDLLAYKNIPWGGVTGEHWFVGAAGVNGFIRSAGELKRWKDANTQYRIWDASNLNPDSYLLSSAISDWAKAASKPTYNLDEVQDGTTRKLANYLALTGGTLKGALTFADSNGNAYGAIRAEKIGNDEYLYLLGNDGVLIDGLSVRKDNAIVPIEDVFLNLTGGMMEPGATITLQEIENNIPVQTLVASQRWVNAQGFLTSAAISGYATTSQLNTGLEAKQNIIHFFNTKNSNTEVSFSNIYLPLSYQGGGTVYLDLSDYATTSALSGYLPLTGGSLSNDLTIASNKYLRFGSNSGGLLIHNTTNGNNSLDISANRINLNVENGLFCNGVEVPTTAGVVSISTSICGSLYSAIQSEFVAKAGSSMTGALSMGNGINVNFGDCSVTSNGSAQGNIQAGKILKLMGNYVAVTAGDNADANFTVNGNIVATRPWVTTQLGGYLPLTAGSSKPLTGSLYVTPGAGIHQTVEIRGSQYNIGLTIGAGNVNRGLYGYTIGGSNDWLLYFNASNTILNYGNVGIGTTTPDSKLHVANECHFAGGAKFNNICIEVNNSIVASGRGNEINNYNGQLLLQYNSSTNCSICYGGGNVGIGTITPQAKLDVNGSVKIAGSLTGVTTISTSGGIFAGGNIETKGSFVWCDSQNFSLTIMEGLAVSGDVNYCCALFRHKPQVQLGSDMLEVVVAKSDENGIEFRGSEDGTYTFGYGSGRGDIYAGAGDFTGAIETTSYNFRGTADAYGHGGASISHKSGSSVEGLEYYAGRSGQHYFKAYNSNGNEVYANIHCLTCDETSDIRKKEVVEYLNPSVYDIANAPIIKFRWIDGGNDLHLGSISQYWEKTLPETVHIGDDLMQSIEKSTIALLAGITAARKAVDNERRIAELEQRVAELESLIS